MVNFGVTAAVSAESITTEAGVDEAFTVKRSFKKGDNTYHTDSHHLL